MLLAAFLACAASGDSSGDTSAKPEGCWSGPSITITSPEGSATLPVNEAVALTAEASSEVDDAASLRILWAVAPNGGNTDNIGTHLTESWTPTEVGIWTIFAQVEDSCTDDDTLQLDPVQDSVRVDVE